MAVDVCDVKDSESRLVSNARKYIVKNFPRDEQSYDQFKLNLYMTEQRKKIDHNPKFGIRITMIVLWPVVTILFLILLLTKRKK